MTTKRLALLNEPVDAQGAPLGAGARAALAKKLHRVSATIRGNLDNGEWQCLHELGRRIQRSNGEKPPDEKPKRAKRKSASFNFGRKHAFAPTEAPPPSPLADATPGRGTPPPTSRRIESTIHRDPADFATFESPPDGLQHRPLVDPLA